MTIQVLKPKYHVEECLDEIRECLEIGWTGMGFKTVKFEEAWKEYTGHAHAHFINSNTVGLNMAVEILKRENGWADGDEIITTPITFISTNHAIALSKLKPVFADVDETLCLSYEDVKAKITDKTRAVMFVGYGGRAGDLKKIVSLCQEKGIKVILDAAHMSGTRIDGVMPGVWEGIDVTVYSFQAVKNLPTADSGMICFADEHLDAICRKIAWLGINKDTYARTSTQGSYKWKYDVEYIGYKDHGNSIIASIGLVQLKYLDEDNARRREIAAIYDSILEGSDAVKVVATPHKDECSYHLYEIIVPDRDAIMNALAEKDIYTGVHYRDNTEYEMYSFGQGTCPYAHEVSQHILTLPVHLYLTDEEARMIAEEVLALAQAQTS